ncbi:DeoR/GlpR family DNA-binding transcription regulator [Georgenia halophila]|uniref:DeoR/GlpR family DNA-binding transcription regulator n=2 Tax=Georgenia halophila TaxID=620889 RepID=A0ABP8KUH7_9MICO
MLEIVSERSQLSVDEAVAELGVSPATVRRDLDQLSQQQLVTRTRGGVVAANTALDLPLRYKAGRRAAEKERIAKRVVQRIPPGSVVGLNGGTTALAVAQAIALEKAFHAEPGQTGVTVVTTALNIATELAVRPHVKVVVVGGVVRSRSYEVLGPLADRMLDVISLDVAVLGVDAVDAREGAMAFDEGEAATNALLAARADTVMIAADSTKLGSRVFARILPVEDIDVLVTDSEASSEVVDDFRDAGVDVVTS